MNEAQDNFICAYVWNEFGDEINLEPIRSCNGKNDTYMAGEDYDVPEGKMVPMGSIIVKSGCTLYGFDV